ncbi:MAG: FAD-dependent oxidoreductase [Ktedonobacter sp. 13_1_20CM_3_54_15]|nr:MAG: FAD-dependent oxidoreductase [Ktedonobacter sp. 13_1_20CM_3_54_15]
MLQSVRVDVLIIGAGIMGASCAYRLSERGMSVAVLEAQTSPAMGSTGYSVAGVRVQFTEEVNIRISWESIQEYQHFQDLYGEDAGYRPIGYLFLVPPERWAVHMDGVRLQERIGAPVRVLTVEEAQSLVQFEPAGIAGTTHGLADGVVDPHSITFTYLRLAKESGATIYLETPLMKANRAGNCWQVETPKGIFEADYLVNAAGSWAGEVARRAGLEVPVQPVRRIVYATTATAWQHIYPLTIDLTSGFYLRSEGNRILFGRSNADEPPGFTEGLDWDWFESTISVGMERFPWLADVGLDQQACWWGYYEVTPDHNPILGRMPGVENWVNVAGFSGHGVQQAPAVGWLIAEEIMSGKAQSINIDPLRISRFSSNHIHREQNIV